MVQILNSLNCTVSDTQRSTDDDCDFTSEQSMKSIFKMEMSVDDLSSHIEVTNLDLKGKVQDLFIDICRIILRIDKVLGEDLSYIVNKTNLRMYAENPFYDRVD